jgi:hypothetical protein
MMLPFSCRLSAAGICFLGVLFPPRNSALLTVGLPQHPKMSWTLTGFPRSTRVRYGRVGCPLYPGGDGVHTAIGASSAVVCRLSAASLFSPRHHNPTRGIAVTRHQRGFTTFTLPALPLTCNTQSERASLGFSMSSAPSHYWPRTSRRGPVSNTDQELRLGHVPDLQSTYSLNTCDLVSQRSSACPDGNPVTCMTLRSARIAADPCT